MLLRWLGLAMITRVILLFIPQEKDSMRTMAFGEARGIVDSLFKLQCRMHTHSGPQLHPETSLSNTKRLTLR
jgi:hypothetical protein